MYIAFCAKNRARFSEIFIKPEMVVLGPESFCDWQGLRGRKSFPGLFLPLCGKLCGYGERLRWVNVGEYEGTIFMKVEEFIFVALDADSC